MHMTFTAPSCHVVATPEGPKTAAGKTLQTNMPDCVACLQSLCLQAVLLCQMYCPDCDCLGIIFQLHTGVLRRCTRIY